MPEQQTLRVETQGATGRVLWDGLVYGYLLVPRDPHKAPQRFRQRHWAIATLAKWETECSHC